MGYYIHARIYPGRDDDVIQWLDEQPDGSRSEAIRSLLRDGLRMRQLEGSLRALVQEAVRDALQEVDLPPQKPHEPEPGGSLEEQFGGKLDDLLNGLG